MGGALVEFLGADCCVGTYLDKPTRSGVPYDLEGDDAQALIENAAPDVLFIAAGMTHVDACESDEARAYRINRDGPADLAAAAAHAQAKTVYFSTEYVFDGTDGPYDEDHRPNPLSVYGKSKLAGEQAVQDADPSALVLRTTVVYGPEQQGRNFVYRLVASLRSGREIMVPIDQFSSPTYNRDLAAAAVTLATKGVAGIVNAAGPEVLSRVEFAQRIAAMLELDPTPIRAVETSEFGPASAPRPLQAGLRIDELRRHSLSPRNLEDAIEDWYENPRGRPLLG